MDKARKSWPLLATVWLAAASYSLASAARAEEPLDAFPDQAAAVARIASLDKFAGGFKELTANLGPLGALAGPGLENGLNQAFQIAGDGQALDRMAPAYLAVFPLENEREPVAWMVRAADETKLRRAVLKAGAEETLTPEKRDDGFEKLTKDGHSWYFGRFGDWTLYTSNENVVKLLAFDRAQAKTFASLVEPRAKQMFEAGDGAVFVNAAMLVEKYGEKLTEARERLLRRIDSLPDQALGGGGTGNANPQAAKKLYSNLANLAFDTLGDARWLAGRVNLTAAGVEAAAMLGVHEASGADKLLAANPPSPLENLGLLPSGATAYYGYRVDYQHLLSRTLDFAQLAYGADSPNAKKIKAATELMHEAGLGPKVGSFSFVPGKGLTASTLQQAEHPEKLNAAVAQVEQATEAKTPSYNQTTELKANAETCQGRPVDLLTTRFAFNDVTEQGQKISQKFIEKIFGGQSLETRITTIEGFSVQAVGNDPKYLQQTLDGLTSGEGVLGLDEAFSKTRDQLGDEANLIVLLNAPRFVVDIVGMIRDIPPFDMLLARAPFNFGYQPPVSYAGLAVGAEPQALRLQLYIPVEQPKGVLSIFGQ
ncbi:MAG TPA: hypothetical protein VMV10_26300 [Pirellulales bacterium]|nr:hypothetical protein [Pirellulales bacterium]